MNRSAILIALTAVVAVPGQPPRGKREAQPGGITPAAMAYNGMGIVRLMESPVIQAELKMTAEDKASLPLLRDELAESGKKFTEKLRENTGNRDAFIQTLVAHSKQMDKQIEEILSDRFTRFKQIRRQAFGITSAATADAEVREGLAMTEDQRTKLNAQREALLREWQSKIRGGGKPRVAAEKIDEGARGFSAEEEKLYLSILSEAQQATWKQLVGDSFEIPTEVVRMVRRGSYDENPSAEQGKGDRSNQEAQANERRPAAA